MGLCCCTLISCPLGICAGSSSAFCDMAYAGSNTDPFAVEKKKNKLMQVGIFGTLLMVGIGLYAFLTVICSQEDNEAWRLYKTYGSCWAFTGIYVGFFAGLLMGVGTPGLLYSIYCLYRIGKSQNHSSPNDDDDGSAV